MRNVYNYFFVHTLFRDHNCFRPVSWSWGFFRSTQFADSVRSGVSPKRFQCTLSHSRYRPPHIYIYFPTMCDSLPTSRATRLRRVIFMVNLRIRRQQRGYSRRFESRRVIKSERTVGLINRGRCEIIKRKLYTNGKEARRNRARTTAAREVQWRWKKLCPGWLRVHLAMPSHQHERLPLCPLNCSRN